MTASAEQFALRLHKVSKAFGGVQALNAVDFEVRAGEVHCLAGGKRLREIDADQSGDRRAPARERGADRAVWHCSGSDQSGDGAADGGFCHLAGSGAVPAYECGREYRF